MNDTQILDILEGLNRVDKGLIEHVDFLYDGVAVLLFVTLINAVNLAYAHYRIRKLKSEGDE